MVTLHATERRPRGEEQAIDRVLAVVEQLMMEDARSSRPVPRAQHPKMHGCAEAELVVGDDVPSDLQVGIFARPQTYKAWVRFSASAIHPKPDWKRDAHGVAIKVLGVPGRKILAGEERGTTQDFLFVNDDVFFCRDALEYADFAETVAENARAGRLKTMARTTAFFLGTNRQTFRPRELLNLARVMNHKVDNPLDVRYWTQTPFRLGDRAVKYSLTPCPGADVEGHARSSAERLAEALARTLRYREASFELMVQRQVDDRSMPVENPTVSWKESASPFQTVATLRIPVQDCSAQQRINHGDRLSFTPWHSLPQHAPLGGINRVRRAVYVKSAQLRAHRNGFQLVT
jgi:hypothetical protein